MEQNFINQFSMYWYVPEVATIIISGLFYVVDKFSYNEKDFLNDCKLIKDQNLSKKAKVLNGFIERIKNNFDNAQEIQSDTYILFLGDMARHDGYDLMLDRIRARFKFFRTSLLVIILIAAISFGVGWIFTNLRIYFSILNTILVILAIAILFTLRSLVEKFDNLRHEPNLLS